MAYNHVGDVLAGATSVSIPVLLRKKSDNTELTGIAYNTSGNVFSYQRQGAARVAITGATQTVTGAYSSGGFVEIDSTNQPGLYRLDVPDAAFATGVDFVVVSMVTTSGYAFHACFNLSQVTFTVAGQVDTNVKSSKGTALVGTAGYTAPDLGNLLLPAGAVAALAITDNGTAQNIVSTTGITLRAAAAFGTNALSGAIFYCVSATTGAGQGMQIVSNTNTGGANVIAFESALPITLTGTVVYIIFAGASAPATTANLPTMKVSSGTGTGQISLSAGVAQAQVASVAAAAITNAAFAAGAIDSNAIATDAIGSAELAASAVTEIQTGLSTLAAADVRAAVGLASANLDTQLASIQADTDNLQTRLPAALTAGSRLKVSLEAVKDIALAGDGSATPFHV